MLVTLTVWQKRGNGYPTRAGEKSLAAPSAEAFGAAVAGLLGSLEPGSAPFQAVARVGDSSRGLPLGEYRDDADVAAELWRLYRSLVGTVG